MHAFNSNSFGHGGKRWLSTACLIYLTLPVFLFAAGWLNWYFAVPLLLVLSWCFVLANRSLSAVWQPDGWSKSTVRKVIAACVLLCAVTVLAGVGGLVWQVQDHFYRNALFRALVEHSWPVVRGRTALVYYIGYWLPAALVGKAFGLTVGFLFQIVWTVVGLMLFFLLLCAWRKRIVLWPLIVFLFFSGLDALNAGYGLYEMSFWQMLHYNTMLGFSFDHWSFNMMYPALLTNLFWSFQQAVPMYLLILLLLLQTNCKNYAFLAAPCLLSATLAVIGLIPIALTMAASRPADNDPLDRRWLSGKAAWRGALRDVCSVQNIVGGGLIALVVWLYLSANRSGGYVGLNRTMLHNGFSSVYFWLEAIVLEFGVYILLVAKTHERNVLLPVVFLCLVVCPWLQVGNAGDVCMRFSMAALPFLALMSIDTLAKARQAGKRVLFAALTVTLCIGAVTPLSEIYRTVYRTQWGRPMNMVYIDEYYLFTEPNFNGPAYGNLFFDVLAKTAKDVGK